MNRPFRQTPSIDPAPGTTRTAARDRISVFALVFVFSLILPVFFFVGPVRLAPFLILTVASFVPLCLVWLSGAAGRVILPDVMILGSALWAALSLFVHHPVNEALEPAGIIVLQTFGAYLIGRCCVRGPRTMTAVLNLFLAITLFILPFGLYELVTGVPLYLEFASALGPVYDDVQIEGRLGFQRVQGAFEHPILYGIFSSSMLALAIVSMRGTRRLIAAPAISLATFMSLSTGAVLCFVIQAGTLAYGWLMRHHPKRWRLYIGLVLMGYVVIDLLSDRTPFEVFVSYLTFNSGSAYNRILIWTYGSAEVIRHPVFGIGLNDWERPVWMHSGSFDMFWLLIAMRYGLLSCILLGGACLLLMIRAGKRTGLDRETEKLRLGLIISLTAIFTAIWSVHLWNATFCWMMFLIGCLAWMTEAGNPPGRPAPDEPEAAASAAAAPAAGPRRRTWL